MGKLLFVLLLVIFGYVLLTRRRQSGDGAEGPAAKIDEPMIACAHCGIHVPMSECRESDGYRYCCEEHQRLGPAGTDRQS